MIPKVGDVVIEEDCEENFPFGVITSIVNGSVEIEWRSEDRFRTGYSKYHFEVLCQYVQEGTVKLIPEEEAALIKLKRGL